MREHIDDLVNKAISCGDVNNGFAEYICQDCGGVTKVPFTCIAVIHTFGRDLKWNPHVHALVTEGAIDKNNNWWKSVEYIPYPFLKKAWQKILLDIIKKHLFERLFTRMDSRNLLVNEC